MNPAERVVVAAARKWAAAPDSDKARLELLEAVVALKALEAAGGPVVTEVTRPWRDVVVGDEIYSARTRKWYEVTATVMLDDGRVKVWAKGLPKPIRPMAVADVLVRRGEMGLAVDVFASVLWSGQNAPDAPETSGPIIEVDVTQDPEASAPEPETASEDDEDD